MSQRRPLSLLNPRRFLSRSIRHKRQRLRTQLFEQLEPRIVMNSDWQNPARPLDVNNDLNVTPLDILLIINRINSTGTGPLGPRTNPLDHYVDTSGDGQLTPLDILRIINGLNNGVSNPDPGDGDTAPAGFISIPLTNLPGNSGQIVRTTAEMTVGRVEFNEMGVFAADDASGRVLGVLPSSPNYAQTVFSSGRRRVLFSRLDEFRTTNTVDLPANSALFVYVLQRATSDGDPTKHLQALPLSNGMMRVGWEERASLIDLPIVGNRGFDDVIVDFHFASPVNGQSPPVINAIPVQSIAEQSLLTVNIATFDPDLPNDTLTYSLDTGPVGAAIDPTSGRFTWTPNEVDGPGQFEAIIRVTDSFGLSDAERMIINVLEVNRPPVLAPIADIQLRPGDSISIQTQASDPDLPANQLSYALQSGAPNGASIHATTGMFRYTAPVGLADTDLPVTVVVRDNAQPSLSASRSFVIRVRSDRRSPILNTLANQTVNEQTQLLVNVSATDADLPNDTLTYSLDSAPSGAAINAATGRFTWTPTEENGPGQFEAIVRVTDQFGLFDTATMAISVLEVNRPPVLEPIADVFLRPGERATFSLNASDPDVPTNSLAFALQSGAPTGATLNATTGLFRYTAPSDIIDAVFPMTVIVSDNGQPSLSASRSFNIRVSADRTEPVIEPIAAQTINEQTQLVVDISASDADLPNDTLIYSLDSAPSGAMIDAATGRFSWTPTEANGPGQFEAIVRVTDQFGLFDTATMAITVLEVNRPPVLEPIADVFLRPGERATLSINASDPDVPANNLAFTLQSGAPTGATLNATTGLFRYTAPNNIIDAVFPLTVIVSDNGQPSLSASRSFNIRVSADRTEPVIEPIAAQTINEQTQLVVDIAANDVDLPNDTLTYSLDSAPSGAAIDATTGRFTWTPTEANGPGQFEAIVRVTDQFGLFDTATLAITVLEVNRPPVLEPIADVFLRPGERATFSVNASDPDVPANSLAFTLQSGAPTGATLNATTGLFRYTAPSNIIDAVFPVTVIVSDNGQPSLSASRSFNIRVSADRTEPVIEPIAAQTINEQTQLVVDIAANDADLPNDTLIYSLDSAPSGAAIDAATGRFTWTPTEANGPGQFEAIVRVTDQFGLFGTASMAISVLEVNRPPVLEPIADVFLRPGERATFSLNASDPDVPANSLAFMLQSGAPTGATLNATTGLFRYTAPSDIIDAVFPVTVTVSDNGQPSLSASRSFNIRVSADRTEPVIEPIAAQTINEQTQLVADISANDADLPNDALIYALDSAPNGAAIDAATGRFTWTPSEANGPGQFEAIVRVTDQFGLFDTATMAITVLEVNRPPVLEPIDSLSMKPGESISIQTIASDPDLPVNTLTFTLQADAPEGANIDPSSGLFQYTAPADTIDDEFTVTVTVTDNGQPALSSSRSFTIEVHADRTEPLLEPIPAQSIPEETTLVVDIRASDADLPNDVLVYSLDAAPLGATIDAASGRFTWTPSEADGPGQFEAIVRVTDRFGLFDTAVMTIEVLEVNLPPQLDAIDDIELFPGDTMVTTPVASDPDIPANQLTFSLTSAASGATIDPQTGIVRYTAPATVVERNYLFTMMVSDNGQPNLTASQSFAVRVHPRRIDLIEADRLVTEHRYPITIPGGTQSLTLDYIELEFDESDPSSMNDAFEVALLDQSGRPAAAIISPSRDANANISESVPLRTGIGTDITVGAIADGGQISIDVSHLPVGFQGELVARLVNNDTDNTTRVGLATEPLYLAGSEPSPGTLTPPPFAPSLDTLDRSYNDVDWRHLADVTGSFSVAYDTTAYDTDTKRVAAGVTLTSRSQVALRSPLLIVVDGISLPAVVAAGTASVLPADPSRFNDPAIRAHIGSPFYDASSTIADSLMPGESLRLMLEFSHQSLQRFDYDLTVLGTFNAPPMFTTTPNTTASANKPYIYPSRATDPDSDTLTYSLVAGPTGLTIDAATGDIRWLPTISDTGAHRVTIRAEDPFGGSDEQSFSLTIANNGLNRPPQFVSDPVIDAYVGMPYRYSSRANDPDADPLAYTVLAGPTGLSIEAGPSDVGNASDPAGNVAWIPPAAVVDTYQSVKLHVNDGRGGEAVQEYRIYVHPNPLNLPPTIVTQPESNFRVPLLDAGNGQGDVDPQRIEEVIARGQTTTRNVTLTLPPTANRTTADVVLVVDESGSMAEQAWVADVIEQLEQSLVAKGVTDNRYALVGYGSGSVAPRVVTEADYVPQSLIMQVYGPKGELILTEEIHSGGNFPDLGVPASGAYTVTLTGKNNNLFLPLPGQLETTPIPFRISADVQSTTSQQRTGWGMHAGVVQGSETISFTGSAGDMLVLDGLVGSGILRQLLDPDGKVVLRPGALLNDPEPLVLAKSGTYQLRLSGDNAPYQLQLLNPQNDATSLSLGTSVTSTLQPYETELYRLTAPEQLTLFVDRWLSSGVASPLTSTRLRLMGDNGVITPPLNTSASSLSTLDISPLTLTAGNYYLIVDTASQSDAQALEYSFTPRNLSANLTQLSDGVPASVNLQQGSNAAAYEFTAVRGQTFNASFAQWSGGEAQWSVIDEYGQVLASGEAGQGIQTGQIPIREDGRYVLLLQGSAIASGATQFQITPTFSTTTINDYSGLDPVWESAMVGIAVLTTPLDYVADLEAGESFFATILPDYQAGVVTLTVRSPSGGVVFSDTITTNSSDTSLNRIASPRLIAHESGTYQITIETTQPGSSGFSAENVVVQLASGDVALTLNTLVEDEIRPGLGVRAFQIIADAGQVIELSQGEGDAWAGWEQAADRASRLLVSGGFEDGYWGIDFALTQLDFRPEASQQIILLTDEDRDIIEQHITRDSLTQMLLVSQAGLHSIVAANMFDNSGQNPLPALGALDTINELGNSIARLYYPDGSGGFTTVDVTDYTTSAFEGTEFDYIDLVRDLGGSNWGIENLRMGSPDITQSFTNAFVSVLTDIIGEKANVGLRPVATTAGGLPNLDIGEATIQGRQVTFRVTFYGDGDAWNFDLEFFDADNQGLAYGQVPVALAAGYRYDVLAIDPEDDELVYELTQGAEHGASFDPATRALLWRPTTPGDYEFAVTARDPWGGIDEQSWTVTVSPPAITNTPPVVEPIDNMVQEADRILAIQVAATDSDGDALTYRLLPSAINGALPPLGLVLDASTGLLSWRPNRTQFGLHEITVQVVDGHGGRATESFSIEVIPRQPSSNLRPVITSRAVQSAPVGLRYRYEVEAYDPDGDAITYSLASAPAGMVIDRATGIVSWRPDSDQIGVHSVVVRVTDEVGGVALQAYSLSVFAVNDPPEITSSPRGPAVPGAVWRYQVTATDPNGDPVQVTLVPGSFPSGASIDPNTGLLQWTPTATGAYRFAIEASDGRGGRVQQEFVLPVSDAAPPRIISEPTGPARIGQPYEYLVIAYDANVASGNDQLIWSLDDASLARGLTLSSAMCPAGNEECSSATLLTWTPSALGEFPITLTVTDGNGQHATQRYVLPVVRPTSQGNPPEILSTPEGPALVGQTWNYQVAARDLDQDPLSYHLVAGPNGMTLDAATGLIGWTPTAVSSGEPVELYVQDPQGNRAWQRFQLPVLQQLAGQNPIFRSIPTGPAAIEELWSYTALAIDPDGTSVSYALGNAPLGMTLDATSGRVQWRPSRLGWQPIAIIATDADGQSSTQSFEIEVVAGTNLNRPPEFSSTPQGPAARDLPYSYQAIASDPDGDAVAYSLDAASLAMGMTLDVNRGILNWIPSAAGDYEIQITATDPLGATATQLFTLPVVSNAPPQIISSPTTRIDLGQSWNYDVDAIDPNSGDTLTYFAAGPSGLIVDANTGVIQWTSTVAGRFVIDVAVQDQDGAGDTQRIELLVVDPANNNPPVITDSPRTRLQFGTLFVWQIPAVDPDQDPLNFSLINGPAGLTVDNSGLLQWTPDQSQITSGSERHSATVEVNDGRGGTAQATWQFSVGYTAENQAPSITSVKVRGIAYPLGDEQAPAPEPLRHAVAGRVYQALFAADDPDGDTLVWSLVDAPPGVRIDARGLVDYRPTINDVGSVDVQVRVTDTAGASAIYSYTLTTRGGNSPARISGNPPVHHRRDTLYSTTFTANDPDGDAITFSFVAGSNSHGAALDASTGLLTWTPTSDGTYRFAIAAADPIGEGTQLVFDVLVDQFGPNDPPVFDDTQPGVAEVGSLYARRFPAVDPDGDTLTYAVQQGPAGLTIHPSTGNVTWNAPASLLNTNASVLLSAADPAGHTAYYQFTLPVRAANRPPRFDSQPGLSVSAGAVYRYDIWASDPDFDPLTLSLASAPAGMTLDTTTGQLSWNTTAANIGSHGVTLRLTDDRIASPVEQAFTLTVVADTTPPELQLFASQTLIDIDSEVGFEVRAWDDVGIVERTLIVASSVGNSSAVALSSQGFGRFTFSSAGRYTATATARDAAGNVSNDQLEILVRDPNNSAPSLTFVSPDVGSQLSAPTPVHLTVLDPEQDLVSLRLVYAPSDGSAPFLQFAQRDAPTGQTLGNLTDQAVGMFDPTNLVNGSYIIRAIAEDAGFNQSTRDVVVQVSGRLKLGNFSASFDDLSINVGGIPITIMRSYDTLDVNQLGDFGNGWTLDVKQAHTQIDASTLGGLGSGRYRAFVDGTRVMVTTPEGTEEGFTFRAIPDQTLFGIVLSWKSNFDPDAGNNYKLEAPAGGLTQLGSEYLSGLGTTFNPQDPEFGNSFQLSSISERLKYNINASSGKTVSLEDRNENKLTIRPDGIISNRGRSLVFERDMQGRIAKITDPRGNSLLYQYDSVGNLTAFTDRMGNTTRMTYHTAPAHYLDTVVDPLGNTALKAVYTQPTNEGGGQAGELPAIPGRLSRLEDATGSFMAFDYNTTARTQTVSDEDGIQAQVQFDELGNAIDHKVRGGERVVRTFDDPVKGLPTQEVTVIGELDPAPGEGDDQVMTRTYNQYGQVTSEKDERGNVTRYLYNAEGIPYATINPDGSSTNYSFDDKYNLISSSSSNGGTTWMTYDSAGQVTEVVSGDLSGDGSDDPRGGGGLPGGGGGDGNPPRGNITKLKYNQFGDIIETIDTEQNSRAITYDANGNQLGTSFTWTDPNDANNSKTLLTSHVVAANDETSSSTTPTGTSHIEFDVLDRGYRSIDENGFVTESRYDLRGLIIETRTQGLNASGAPVWLVSRSVFDDDGNAVYSTDSLPEGTPSAEIYGTHNIYDSAGRVVRSERRLGVDIAITGLANSLASELVSAGTLITSSDTHYDSAGRVWQTIDNYGRRSQTLFDRWGQTIETRSESFDAAGQQVWLTSRTVFDSLGRVILATDRYVMPADTELGAGTSPAFYATLTVYDSQGRNAGSQRVADASVTIAGTANTLEATIAARGTLLYESKTIYDTRGRVTRSVSPTGEITDYVYDSRDRQIATIGTPQAAEQVGLGEQYPGRWVRLRSETEFNAYGQAFLQRTGVIQVEQADGTLVTIDRSDARQTESRYDAEGRLISTIYPDGTSVSSEYDEQGRVLSETNQLGLERSFEYDTAGRLTAVVLPSVMDPATGSSVQPRYEYGYDEQGNQTLLRDPLGRETRFTFDSSGRQLSRTLPLGYGADGIEGTADDSAVADGDWTERFTYDAEGRMETHLSFEGVMTRYVYDDTNVGGGRLLQQRFYPTLAAYEANPESPAESWSYAYDEQGRQVSVTTTGAQPRQVSSHYDELGRLTLTNSPEGAIQYQYDEFSRKTAMRVGKTLANGQDISSFTPERATQYTYDPLSRLQSVTEVLFSGSGGGEPDQHQYFYDLLGSLDAELSSSGLLKDYVYDNMQRLRSLIHYTTDGTVADASDLSDNDFLVRFDYTLRADGRRTAADELWYTVSSATQSTPLEASYGFTYDNLGRLTDEVFDHWDDALDYHDRFVYDPVGNRLEKSRDARNDSSIDSRTSYNFDANDRLIDELAYSAASDPQSRTTYTYDHTQNTGSTQTSTASNFTLHSTNFTYDLQGRLFTATVTNYNDVGVASSITRSTYDYDHTGIRVLALNEIDANADGTYETRTKLEYLVDHHNHTGYQQVVRESHYDAAAGTLLTTVDLTYGHDELYQTTTEYDSAGNVTSTVRHYFLHDGKASVRGLLEAAVVSANLTHTLLQLYHYTAYGELHALHTGTGILQSQAAALTSVLYNGEQFDRLTQQHYLRARYYNPANAQFNRLDPFFGNQQDPQSFHKYAYVHGDPMMGSDPTGKFGVAGTLSGSIIGAQLNSMTGEGGQFVAESFRRKQVAWDVAAWALAGSFLFIGMATIEGASRVLGPQLKEAVKRMPWLEHVFSSIGRLPASLILQIALPPRVQRAILRVAMFASHGFDIFGKLAHHLVPLEALTQFPELMKRAAKGGFNINGLENGRLMKGTGKRFSQELFEEGFEHFGNHPEYNAYMMSRIAIIADSIGANTPNVQIAQMFTDLAAEVDGLINAGLLIVK